MEVGSGWLGMLQSSQLCSRASPVGYTDNLILTSQVASASLSGHTVAREMNTPSK